MEQLSVFVENKVGSLAQVTDVLYKNNINLRAVSAFDSPDYGILRLIVDKPEAARNLLADSGFAVTKTQILAVELEDKPGDLDKMLGVLADAGLNLNYIYSFVLRDGKSPLMVIKMNDPETAERVLRENGIKVVED